MRHVALFFALAALVACAPSPDAFTSAVRSTSSEQLSDLLALMDRHGLPHRPAEPQNGMEGFSYRHGDQDRVEALRTKLTRRTALKYSEPEAREYLIRLLTEMNHDYIVQERPDGTWIKWFPDSEAQSKEVSAKVVEFMRARATARAGADCRAAAAPSAAVVADATQARGAACPR